MEDESVKMEPSGKQPQPRSPTTIAVSSVPTVYANGFEVSVTGADIFTLLALNNRPAIVLNLSFTTAKALGRALSEVIADIERGTQIRTVTTDDIAKAMEKHTEPSS